MIASLPMYDRPTNRDAHDRLWAGIRDNLRRAGRNAPDELDRDVTYRDTWARPDLVLGQICIFPYRTGFAQDVTLIGTSDYGLDGCHPGYFRALFVCRRDDERDLPDMTKARFAANANYSFSGYVVAQQTFAQLGLALPTASITGAHDASVRAVARGDADFACIDAQTWRMQQSDLPETTALRVMRPTAQAPGQSFITRQSTDPAPYFQAIKAAIAALSSADQSLLSLRDIVTLPATAYA